MSLPERILNLFTLSVIPTWVAVVRMLRRPWPRRHRLAGLTAAVLCLTTVSQPGVVDFLLGSLEWRCPPLEIQPSGAAVVVLADSAAAADGWRRTAELSPSTHCRCLNASEVARRWGTLPIPVSRGPIDAPTNSPTCARLMRNFLLAEGIPRSTLVAEAALRTTYENAAECRERLGLRPPGAVSWSPRRSTWSGPCVASRSRESTPCRRPATTGEPIPILAPSSPAWRSRGPILLGWRPRVGRAGYRLDLKPDLTRNASIELRSHAFRGHGRRKPDC